MQTDLTLPTSRGRGDFDFLVGRWTVQLGQQWNPHTSTSVRSDFRAQYVREQVFAFGLTGLLLALDFWTALFFVVVPQLWGARGILRINLIQHEGCDVTTEWNHSRNFVGRAFNWIMCNNGYHTIHHNRAGLHWSVLDEAHRREVVPRLDPALDERSMVLYLLRTYLVNLRRPGKRDVAAAEVRVSGGMGAEPGLPGGPPSSTGTVSLAPREVRRAEAEAMSA